MFEEETRWIRAVAGGQHHRVQSAPAQGLLLGMHEHRRVILRSSTSTKMVQEGACFSLYSLNKKLSEKYEKVVEHDFKMLPCLLHSVPLKIICWIKNTDQKPLTLKLRRIQNCSCVPVQTRVSFNQFRFLFHCPHRRLVHTNHEELNLPPDDITALSLTFYYYMYGDYKLTFELT